jgi:sacsin
MEEKSESPIESCGQSERLVDRLRDLIKGYGDGLDVFKELIQNADDAGATCMKICLDTRMNNE